MCRVYENNVIYLFSRARIFSNAHDNKKKRDKVKNHKSGIKKIRYCDGCVTQCSTHTHNTI